MMAMVVEKRKKKISKTGRDKRGSGGCDGDGGSEGGRRGKW